jgi:hypothetical protein
MKKLVLTLAAVLAIPELAVAQTTNLNLATTTNGAPATANETPERAWSLSATVTGYLIPDSRDYVQPTVSADRGWLHLEARYNYEALETGSAWVGYNFSVGKKLTLDFTPMVGGVFGHLNGVAPGYEATLSWWKLELYTEGEFVFSTGDRSDNFFYSWSELSLAPVDWFRFGLVAQRTKAYQTNFDIQRGFLVGLILKHLDFTTYIFNPDDKPTIVLGVSTTF